MIEVFKTNVIKPSQAKMLTDQIHQLLPGYTAGFDLEDCDKILRVQATAGPVEADTIIQLVAQFGFEAAVLPDELPVLI